MNIAVVFAGGVGTRMHSKELPKQFLVVHGIPVIVRTVNLFQSHSGIDAIVIACVEEWIDRCQELMESYGMNKVKAIVSGGETGQLSIFKGLEAAEKLVIDNDDKRSVVLIHDGVRPLVSAETVSAVISSVREFGTAVTCAPATETIAVESKAGEIEEIIPREHVKLARAPQGYWLDEVLCVQRDAISKGIVNSIDTASLMKSYGYRLNIVEGSADNIKVTTPADFLAVQAILDARENTQIDVSGGSNG